MQRHVVTLAALSRERASEAVAKLARTLDGGTVTAPDDAGLLEVELSAASRDEAIQRVRDAIAAAGLEERVAFAR